MPALAATAAHPRTPAVNPPASPAIIAPCLTCRKYPGPRPRAAAQVLCTMRTPRPPVLWCSKKWFGRILLPGTKCTKVCPDSLPQPVCPHDTKAGAIPSHIRQLHNHCRKSLAAQACQKSCRNQRKILVLNKDLAYSQWLQLDRPKACCTTHVSYTMLRLLPAGRQQAVGGWPTHKGKVALPCKEGSMLCRAWRPSPSPPRARAWQAHEHGRYQARQAGRAKPGRSFHECTTGLPLCGLHGQGQNSWTACRKLEQVANVHEAAQRATRATSAHK